MGKNETLIVGILNEEGCFGQENMITPKALIEKCKAKGLTSVREIEMAIVSLIDSDVIEYEMDDKTLETTQIWLL